MVALSRFFSFQTGSVTADVLLRRKDLIVSAQQMQFPKRMIPPRKALAGFLLMFIPN
jgi:hypothetical protein